MLTVGIFSIFLSNQIKATERANNSHTASAILVINVTDVNDNNPMFGNRTYEFSLEENCANGTSVGEVMVGVKQSFRK